MNACGQHGLAHIGLHGSSLKAAGKLVPAAQVMLGGGTLGDGLGRADERVIKVPSKRVTQALRFIIDDYAENAIEDELFHHYYDRQTKDYFYRLLKPLADLTTLTDSEFVDWGHEETFQTAIGVGECAGVMIDLVATLLFEAEEKLGWANDSYNARAYADTIYHAYSVFVSGAKALLLDKGIHSSSQHAIIRDFDTNFVETGEFPLQGERFSDLVLQINKQEPSEIFAKQYLAAAIGFYETTIVKRENKDVVNV